MAKLVLFGAKEIAQIAKYYFDTDSEHEVVAFTLDEAYLKESTFEGCPVVPFEEVQNIYPPQEYQMFIAIGFGQMNKLREIKFNAAVKKGYYLVTYISSSCSYKSIYKPGANCFIFEDNTIQPFVKIKDNVTLWSGNHIGHHSIIESHNFLSSHVVISGNCHVKSNCFLGVNATIGDKVIVAEETLVGAGAVLTKNTEPKGIYVPPRTVKLEKNSDQIKIK